MKKVTMKHHETRKKAWLKFCTLVSSFLGEYLNSYWMFHFFIFSKFWFLFFSFFHHAFRALQKPIWIKWNGMSGSFLTFGFDKIRFDAVRCNRRSSADCFSRNPHWCFGVLFGNGQCVRFVIFVRIDQSVEKIWEVIIDERYPFIVTFFCPCCDESTW